MPDASAQQDEVLPEWQGFRRRTPLKRSVALSKATRAALGSALFEVAMPSPLELCVRYRLSPCECRVALELAKGHSNAEVAAALGVSPHTARHHTSSVMAKLQLSTRRQVRQVLLGGGRAVA